jgi:hypothetical protein
MRNPSMGLMKLTRIDGDWTWLGKWRRRRYEDAEEVAPAENSENTSPVSESKRSSLPKILPYYLVNMTRREIKDTIGLLRRMWNTLAKNANMGAIAEYRKEADYLSQ